MSDNRQNISDLIDELISYGERRRLISADDGIYCINRLLELFGENEYAPSGLETSERKLHFILEDMTQFALSKGILASDTTASRDLFDTKIMGLITPAPSTVRGEFMTKYRNSPKEATDWYYDFSQATNYIRSDRIAKDIKWSSPTPYGTLDITINLSKPEKDPRDIANALKVQKSGYPLCLLCRENEGYAGTLTHPARQNHRIIPIKLCGQQYFLQYSPYVYYNEHCIVFNEKHTPMKIDEDAFAKLLDFIQAFPHYTIGSNADLPIVGGSILTHDHFQGGNYEFPMVRAEYAEKFTMKGFDDIEAGIINWPLSTIRLRTNDMASLVKACTKILSLWRSYTDESAFIYAYTDENGQKTPHNTITPIARMRGGMYEMDLVLRNNITTEEHPLGVYHPHSEYHHIKKENIGLIEVMGLAILPARLREELADITSITENALSGNTDDEKAVGLITSSLESDEKLCVHADWVKEILTEDAGSLRGKLSHDNTAVSEYYRKQVGIVFSHVLENAGVYKQTDEGLAAFKRFTALLSD